jgi:two-component system sensor histidine kinase VanS
MTADHVPPPRPLRSARLRLALSYAVFLAAAGIAVLAGVYVVLVYLIASKPVADGTNASHVYVAASREDIRDALVTTSGLILVFLAVVGIAGGWVLAGRMLRPLQRISEAARIAATGRLDHRVRLEGRHDEFRQLADTFDAMLDRLHDAFSTQERFAANASHELRTPLAITATMLDVARRNPGAENYPVLLDRLQTVNARAVGLTEALLRLADANAINAASERVDLATIAGCVVADHRGEADERRLSLGERLEPAATDGDPGLLEQLVQNLVQNAIRHNHEAGSICVTTHSGTGGTVELRVENTGARYTAEETARLAEPFLRGEGRTSRAGRARGYGLGLALVSRIVAVHHGTLDISPRRDGGLEVTVTLPAVSGPASGAVA